jgi:ankyrin repeat protein
MSSNKTNTGKHSAADSGNKNVFQLLVETYEDVYSDNKRDKWGRTILHWAALNGQAEFCKVCVIDRQIKVDAKDNLGRSSIHLAAQGKKGHLVVGYLVESSSTKLICIERDDEGRTPLHLACAKGNREMVEKLLSLATTADDVKHYIEQADGFGKTALQMAAGGGHTRIVRLLLEKGCDSLSQRDVNGSTVLHYATQAKDPDVALAISQSILNKYDADKSNEKSLLLWASAAGIGTAEEREGVEPFVKDFFLREKKKKKKR